MTKFYHNWFSNLLARIVGKSAITIGGKIFFKKNCITLELLSHELCHVDQFKKKGFWKFILLYLIENVRHGYYKNKYEILARAEYEKYRPEASGLLIGYNQRKK